MTDPSPLRDILFGLMLIFFGMLLYVLMCGNTRCHRNGIVGRVYRMIHVDLPERCCPRCTRDDCMGTGGPCRYFVIIFFAILYAEFGFAYFWKVWPWMNRFIPGRWCMFWQVIVILAPPLPWVWLWLTRWVDPGRVTKRTVGHYLREYPYDNVLYTPHSCWATGLPAPARSRYCQFTGQRIARYDHYCPWVVAPIGERNMRWFLLFLLGDTVNCALFGGLELRFLYVVMSRLRVKWSDTLWDNARLVVRIALAKPYIIVSLNAFMFAIVLVMLIGFLAALFVDVCKGKTQIEGGKIAWLPDDKRKGYRHVYNAGAWANWRAVMFPRRIELDVPVPPQYVNGPVPDKALRD